MRLRKLFLAALIPFIMAGSLPVLKYRALDNSGNPIASAKLYFYTAGTTTPLATYSDEALSVANANPVVADGYGWFGEIYLKTDSTYKVVMKNSAATTTYFTVDNIHASKLTGDLLATRLKQVASNPIDYGAVGDGVADEYSYVQDAIDAATGTVDLLGKTYRCDTGITIPSGITLKNGTLDFTNCTDARFVSVQGSIGTSVATAANIAAGATSFTTTSAAGMAAGDWLLLSSNEVYITGGSTAEELVQIAAVSGTTITVTSPIQWSYETANSANTREITDKTEITIDDVSFLSTNSAGSTIILSFLYATDIVVKNSTFNGARLEAIEIEDSANIHILNTLFENSSTASGSGIDIEDATRNVTVDGCTFKYGIYGIEIPDGRPARWVNVLNSTFDRPTKAIYIQGYIEDLNISGNTFLGDGGATHAQIDTLSTGGFATNISITDNSFSDGTVAIDLLLYTATDSFITISDNNILSGNIQINEDSLSPADVENISVVNNYLRSGSVAIAAVATGAGNLASVDVSGNTIDSGYISLTDITLAGSVNNNRIVSGGITIADAASATADVESYTVVGNYVGAGNISITGSLGSGSYERVIVSKNTLDAGKISVTGTPATVAIVNLDVSSNQVTHPDASPIIDIAAVGMANISNNQIAGAAATYGIEITDIDDAMIVNNYVSNADIRLTDGTTNVTSATINVSDNYLLDGQITFAGTTSTSTYAKISISRNQMNDGISATNSATTSIETLVVNENIIYTAPIAKVIDLNGANSVIVANNEIEGDGATTTYGIEITGSAKASVSNNVIEGLVATTDYGILIGDTGTGSYAHIIDNYALGLIAITQDASDSLGFAKISGNLCSRISANESVGVGSFNRIDIENNFVSGPASANPSIEVDNIPSVTIVGNTTIGDGVNTTIGIIVSGEATDTNTSATVSDNIVSGSVTQGIAVNTLDEAKVSDNRINVAGTEGIYSESTDNIIIVANHIVQTGAGEECIDIQESDEVVVGQNILDCADDGIEVENSAGQLLRMSINGNIVDAEDSCIHINHTIAPTADTQSIAITGNSLRDSANANMVDFDGYAHHVTISDNSMRKDNDTGDTINMAGDAAGAIDSVIISGNIIYNGAYGVGEGTDANTTNVVLTQNTFMSIGTSPVEMDSTTVNNEISVGDLAAGDCTPGELSYDTAGAAEICHCVIADTWYCETTAGAWDTTGPTD